MKIYYDLNVKQTLNEDDVIRYVMCGYSRLAVNTIIDINDFDLQSEKNKAKKTEKKTKKIRPKVEKELIATPVKHLITLKVKAQAEKMNTKVELFTRVTMVAENLNKLKTFIYEFKDSLKAFDIIAVEARSTAVLENAAAQNGLYPLDLVAINLSEPLPQLNSALFSGLRERGLRLEVDVTSVIGSNIHAKRNLACLISEMGSKGRSLVTLSSAANSLWLVRDPHMLRCLVAAAGGCDKTEFSCACTDNPAVVLTRGLARRYTVYGAAAMVELKRAPGVTSVTVISNQKKVDEDSEAVTEPPTKKIKTN